MKNMKATMKYSIMLVLAVLGLASCTSDYDYDAATVSGNQVFFSKDQQAVIEHSKIEYKNYSNESN